MEMFVGFGSRNPDLARLILPMVIILLYSHLSTLVQTLLCIHSRLALFKACPSLQVGGLGLEGEVSRLISRS